MYRLQKSDPVKENRGGPGENEEAEDVISPREEA
jgi:hypothetical protein